jgi:hypothetical protein
MPKKQPNRALENDRRYLLERVLNNIFKFFKILWLIVRKIRLNS